MMSEKNNAECSICGSPYHVCVSCKDEISATPWKVHTDTSEHFKVYQILHGYSTGVYSKEEAKKRFDRVDLSDLNSFRPNIKSVVKNILKENKKNIFPTRPAEQKVEVKVEEVNSEINNAE